MGSSAAQGFKANLLSIAPPPFAPTAPPAGASYLLGYLKANGCYDFDFLDLRLGVPDSYSPTYTYTGSFGESFVHDIPDLPLVLDLISAFEGPGELTPAYSPLLEKYALERGISPTYLFTYIRGLHRYFAHVFSNIPEIRFIGFSVWTTNYLATLIAAAHLKRRAQPPLIIAGGPQVSSSEAAAQLGLKSGLFDVVAVGEGEQTLLEVYNAFARTGSVPEGIPGTIVRSSSGEFVRASRPLMRLTTLPMPSFAEMHLATYQTDSEHITVPLQFSRGCTDKCEFCSEWKFWERFRTDTAEHTVEQIEKAKRDYGATFIIFMDSLLNGIPRRLNELCELLLKRSVDVRWASFMRAQMDAPTARLLARSGCNDVFVGVESFSDETLELMRKRRSKTDNIQAVEAFLDAGIDVTAGFVPGFPGDTREGFIASALILRDIQERYRGRFEVHDEGFVVQPGAPIFHKLGNMGLTGKVWSESYLDIAPAYQDITSRILCSVEGPSQGLERAGRLSVLRTLTEDGGTNSGFAFARAHGEQLSIYQFSVEHVAGGWSLASRKSNMGHVYGLIVNAKEAAALRDLAEESEWESSGDIDPFLTGLESKHVVPPSRSGIRVGRGLYRVNYDATCSFAISPFVVARSMDWRHKRRLLICGFLNDRVTQRPAEYAGLLRFVLQQPRTEDQMWTFCKAEGIGTRSELGKIIDQFKQDGTLVICDHEEPAISDPVLHQDSDLVDLVS